MKLKLIAFLLLSFYSVNVFSQNIENKPQGPYYIGKPTKIEHVKSLASRKGTLKNAVLIDKKEINDGRSSKVDVIIGKGSEGDDILAKNQHRLKNKIKTRAPELIFDTGNITGSPSDPAGAVGPNHYLSVKNTHYQIFDKQGNSLTNGLLDPSTIFSSNGCCDLTASYDNDADRWIISILAGLNQGIKVAVSDGPDPINDDWTIFTISQGFDYNKLSVWRDGYYLTDNSISGNDIHVIERSAVLEGTSPEILSFALPGIVTSGFTGPQVLNISNDNWPTSGGATVAYMQDDAWNGVSNDHIKLWNINIDWDNTSNSVVSAAIEIGPSEGVTPFVSVFDGGSFENLPQPNGGVNIDALQAIIMNQAQYRKFPTHNSAVFNFTVDVDGSSAKQAGVRWYELRQTTDGQPWTLYQEGTYTAPDNRHAWNASMIMDGQGNIGLGYSSMSSPNSSNSNVYVGSYYTGRYASDDLGTMNITEGVIKAGDGNISGTRYGDYSKIDIDPSNDKKFWFVTELVSNGLKDIAGVFQFAPDIANDVGVINIDSPNDGSLSTNEPITVTLFNFGENSASNFEVNYQIDSGTLHTETFTGTIAPQTSAQYTFTTLADLSIEGQTYLIKSSSNLVGDELESNNATEKQVTHLTANDIGVTSILAPQSGSGLGNESIIIEIENFGTVDQSNFNVSYIINGGTVNTETVTGNLEAGSTINYTFTNQGNFSSYGDYDITAYTSLTNDSNSANDEVETTIQSLSCSSNSNSNSIEISAFSTGDIESTIPITNNFTINDVNVKVNIEHSQNSDLEIKLVSPDATEVILSNSNGGTSDNYTNTLFDDDATETIEEGTGPFTGTFKPEGNLDDFNEKNSMGDWSLKINDSQFFNGGELLDWTLELCQDESVLSIEENDFDGNLTIVTLKDKQFEISFTTEVKHDKVNLMVYNVLGQKLLWKTLTSKEDNNYKYNLNLSYAASGVYIIKIGKNNKFTSRKIVVN